MDALNALDDALRDGETTLAVISGAVDAPSEPGSSSRDSSRSGRKPVGGCFGCDRTWEARCYITGDLIIWLYEDGRGGWCCDCHNVHRTMYKSTKPLALYGEQLKDEKAKKEHIAMLVAYLLCKVAGVTSIQVVHINAKRAEVQFLMTLLGFTIGPTSIVPLEELLKDPASF